MAIKMECKKVLLIQILFIKIIFKLISSLSAIELLSHNELDVLFDNDGRFTIEEAEVC